MKVTNATSIGARPAHFFGAGGETEPPLDVGTSHFGGPLSWPTISRTAGAQDRSRVNVHEDYEVRDWTEKWGVSKEQLASR